MKEPSPENSCKTFAEYLSGYLDGQLTGEMLETAEKHLRECPHCARRLEHYTLFKNLINTERHKCPVDLTSVVMAGLERDHLLQGLETLSKPPTPRWVKVARALSAAAMLALIASAGLIIMHFTGNTSKNSVNITQTPPAAIQDLDEAAKSKAAPPRTSTYDALVKENQFDTPTLPVSPSPVAPKFKDPPEPPNLARRMPLSEDLFSSTPVCKGRGRKRFAEEGEAIPMCDLSHETMGIRPNAPLTLRPSPDTLPGRPLAGLAGAKSRGHAWSVELVYELQGPDLPGWMLLKEQVLIALMENDIPTLSESWQVAEALETNREFFYLAKKGLDLPPGSRSAQILLVTHPKTFARIHASLQQAMSDTIGRQLSPELEAYLRSQTITPELVNRTGLTFAALDRAFGAATHRPVLATTQTTQPTTHPSTLPATTAAVLSTSSAPATLPTTRAPTTTPSQSVSTRPNLTQLAVLIKIEIARPTPTTTTAPATQPLQP